MVNQDLLTLFVALTAVAVLIQTGILVGFYFLSNKLSRQADRALQATRDMVGPIHAMAENLQTASARLADLGTTSKEQLRHFEEAFEEKTESLRERLNRWHRRTA